MGRTPNNSLERSGPTWFKRIGYGLLLAVVVGAYFGFRSGLLLDLSKLGRASEWPWFYYLLAVPVLGAVFFLVAAIVSALFSTFTSYFGPYSWRRVAFCSLVIAVAIALLAWPMWLSASGV